MDLEQLRYPIGKFVTPETVTDDQLDDAINILEIFPAQLKELAGNLGPETLDTPYRPEGWTIREVIHHLADSHHNSYIRFKWALSEDNPVIKAYDEKAWSEIGDYQISPVSWSIKHLQIVHHKLVYLLRMLSESQWERTFRHPETDEESTLKVNALRYAWHSIHHYTHIKNALERIRG